ERDRAQARPAQLVDAPGGAFDRYAGRDRGLARRILSLTCGQDLPHDDFGDLRPLDPGTLHRFGDGDLAELVGRKIGECSVECADRRARGAYDDDVVLHLKSPPSWLLRRYRARSILWRTPFDPVNNTENWLAILRSTMTWLKPWRQLTFRYVAVHKKVAGLPQKCLP